MESDFTPAGHQAFRIWHSHCYIHFSLENKPSQTWWLKKKTKRKRRKKKKKKKEEEQFEQEEGRKRKKKKKKKKRRAKPERYSQSLFLNDNKVFTLRVTH